jgi:hypothetical protein
MPKIKFYMCISCANADNKHAERGKKPVLWLLDSSEADYDWICDKIFDFTLSLTNRV